MDQATLHKLFTYDPAVGGLTWLVDRRGGAKAGDRAGCLETNGYRRCKVKGKSHYEHRLIWLYVHGTLPTNHIDHINGARDDNRLSNLREATKAQNGANQGKHSNNTSGHKGIYRDKPTRKWKVQLNVDTTRIYLGCFTNLEDAIAARSAAERQYHGEFARH
jgi:hypothetical protein